MTAAHRPVPENTVVTPASVLTGQVIDVAGFAMHVWAADLPRAEALAATLRVAVPTSLPPTVHVRFEHRAAPPFHAPPFQWSGDVPIETRREGPDLTFVRSDLGLVARVTPEAIVVTGDATDLSVAFRHVFAFAVAQLLGGRDRHVFHAATLALGDGCILVFGPTGAGKSTVALCALRCGWPVLGDDLVVLESSGDRMLATALPRPIAAPPELVDDARAIVMPGDPRARLELPPETVTAGTRSVLGVVVAAHADSPRSTVRDLRAFTVLPIVLTSCLNANDGEAARALLPFAATLSRLPAVELAHGTESGTRVGAGASLLEEIRERFGAGGSAVARRGE